jgi:hypothetical protein
MTFIACLLVTRLVYPSDDRRAAGSTTAMQIFLRAISRGYEPIPSSLAPGGVRVRPIRVMSNFFILVRHRRGLTNYATH